MLVDHYRRDLMDKLVGHRVIIITSQDVDSVCTVRILTSLFKTEGIQYILLSCSGITDMKAKYADYSSQSDKFLMINCGATFDLLETLENPPKEKTFFILDYHRPIHVINYYNSTGQVHIISVPEPEEMIPEFDQIFREVPEDDDDEEVDEENLEERRQRRADYNEWAERRQRILFDYREYSYYARPSALYALEVVWVMSRDDMESIWCTIVSLTDSLIMRRLPRAKYTEFASTVNDHILRISNAQTLPRDCLKVRFGRELFFYLYRHWSVYESALGTPYVVSTLKTWTSEGVRNFHYLLAQLGLPLVEVKQSYLNMSLELRRQLVEMFSSDIVTERFKLPDVVFGSFVAEIGFRPAFNALDMQLGTLAVLEEPDGGKTAEHKFLNAVNFLNVLDEGAHKYGMEKAKQMLKQLNIQVKMMVEMKLVREVGPFLFVQLSDTLVDFNYFKRPAAIPLLVNFLQHSGIRAGKRQWKQSPWVIMIPYDPEYFVAVGIQPGAYEQAEKNIFNEVFRVVKTRFEDDIILDGFDGWTALVKSARRQEFIDLLLVISE